MIYNFTSYQNIQIPDRAEKIIFKNTGVSPVYIHGSGFLDTGNSGTYLRLGAEHKAPAVFYKQNFWKRGERGSIHVWALGASASVDIDFFVPEEPPRRTGFNPSSWQY